MPGGHLDSPLWHRRNVGFFVTESGRNLNTRPGENLVAAVLHATAMRVYAQEFESALANSEATYSTNRELDLMTKRLLQNRQAT